MFLFTFFFLRPPKAECLSIGVLFYLYIYLLPFLLVAEMIVDEVSMIKGFCVHLDMP